MARCPFADHSYPGRSPGRYTGGPYRVVHHTTEGATAAGAISTYLKKSIWPHFTVDYRTTYQHIDTGVSASAVLNRAGGVATNRLSAVQIEIVGFAGQKKDRRTLARVAKLCRWLEATHRIPPAWPNGPPKYGTSNPGDHNRSVTNWRTRGGHYGHSQVPENVHWDPSYWPEEFALVMEGADMQEDVDRININVNGVDQTARIKAYLINGNAVLDASDWCDYASYARPTYDVPTQTLFVNTAKIDGAPADTLMKAPPEVTSG